LQSELGTAAIPRPQGDAGGQVATGTITRDGHSTGVHIQSLRVLSNKLRRFVAVIDRPGKRIFRGQTIVHGDNGTSGLNGDSAAACVVRFQISQHPSAAVKENDHRCRITRRGIQTHRRSAGQRVIFDAIHFRCVAAHWREGLKPDPCLGDSQLIPTGRVFGG
jgi:hypothetical protein